MGCFIVVIAAPDPGKCCLSAGKALQGAGIAPASEFAFRLATRYVDYCGEAWTNVALSRVERGDLPGAVEASQEALSYVPPDIESFCKLVVIRYCLHEGDLNDVVDLGDYRRAVGIASDDSSGWFDTGCRLAERGDRLGAGLAFRRVLELEPDCAEAWLNLGKVLVDPSEATEAFQKAVSINPCLAEGWYQFGRLRISCDDRQAERAFARAVELEPDYGDAWYELGQVRHFLGDEKGAAKAEARARAAGWDGPAG